MSNSVLDNKVLEEYLVSENKKEVINTLIKGSEQYYLLKLLHEMAVDGKEK